VTFRKASIDLGTDVLWLSVAAAVAQTATLMAGILVANIIGTRDFGMFSFLQGTLTTWSQAAALSSGLLATRYLAAYTRTDPLRAGEVIGYCTVITAIAGTVAGIILLLYRSFLTRNVDDSGMLNACLVFVAVIIPITSLTLFQNGALVGFEKYRIQTTLSIFQSVALVLGPVLGAILNGVGGAILGLASAMVVRFVSQRVALRRVSVSMGIRARYSGMATMNRLFFRFALPASLTGITAGTSLWLSTLILIAQDTGPRQMGLFAAAQYFRLLVLFLPVQISTIGVPLLTRHFTSGAHARYTTLLRAGTLATGTIAGVVAIALALAAGFLLRIFGASFVSAKGLVTLLLISAVVEAVVGAMYQALPSREQMWRSFVLVALPRDFTLLIASWLLIPQFLSLGLGYAFLISQTVALVGVIVARSFQSGGW
jgi:O-antigen/teichoic acid export membrane protein